MWSNLHVRWVIAIVVAVGLLFVGSNWIAAHDAAIEMKATIAAQKQVIDQSNETLKQLQQQVQAQQQQIVLIGQQAALVKQQVQTPKQIADEISKYLPALPEPIKVDRTLPDAPVAQIPAADLKTLFDFSVDCKACKARQVEEEKLLATKDAEIDTLGVKLKAVETERNSAIKAAKGGGFWKRAKTAAKWVGVGTVVGYALARKF